MDGVKVLFIIGKGRSGSTLLDNALGQVKGFFSIGQLWRRWQWKPLEDYTCGCGVPVGECPVWSRALEEAFEDLSASFSELSSNQLLDWEREVLRWHRVFRLIRAGVGTQERWTALDSLARSASAIYRALARVTNARVLVDSTKWPTSPGPLSLIPGIEPYVLHLVRDPRAVAYSWQREKYDPTYGQMPTFGAISSSTSWVARNLLAQLVVKRQADRAIVIRYEDFVADPGGTLEAIVRLLGESPDALPLQDDGTLILGPNHNVLGNPNRFSTGPVKVKSDDEWKSRLSRRDAAIVAALTWPLLGRYGYSLRISRAG